MPDQDARAETARDESQTRPGGYAWYVATMLMLIYTLSLLDRKLPFILVQSIKHDLALSDTQIGLLTGVMFALVYSTLAIPIASLADRASRKNIIIVALLVWSCLTSLGGFAMGFWQLSATRLGVAAGEAACSPAGHSMMADYFSPRFRGRAMGLYFLGGQLGLLIGLAVGGWINDLANWRVAFFVLGAPGLILSLLFAFTVREPRRKEEIALEKTSIGEATTALFRQPVFVHMMIGACLFMFTGGALLAFTPAYLIRTFHITTTETGLVYGVTAGLAGIFGSLLGGFASDRLKKYAPWAPLAFVGVTFALSAPSLLAAYSANGLTSCLVLVFFGNLFLMSYAGPSFSTLQSLVPPRMHAMASAYLLFALSGIGVSLGPLFVGALSDHFAAEGIENPLRWAILLAILPMFWAAVHFWIAARKLRDSIPQHSVALDPKLSASESR